MIDYSDCSSYIIMKCNKICNEKSNNQENKFQLLFKYKVRYGRYRKEYTKIIRNLFNVDKIINNGG